MKSRVEQFEEIRRDWAREGTTIRELARRHGVHRRAVRQALKSAEPPAKAKPRSRPHPRIGPYQQIIDQWLIDDKSAPRKQRHTARRIYQRLIDEEGAELAESTVRRYVRIRKLELSLATDEVFCPQIHLPGKDAEVDWGEAEVVLAGERQIVNLFLMRSSFSGAAFCWASKLSTQQAFLYGHTLAFEFFGAVFPHLRYDNLTSAVKKILRGRRRIESDRFTQLRSHYLFESEFTTPGIRGAHEKGGVEGEVGRFRRRHLVPVPEVDSIEQLNQLLRAGAEADLDRRIIGKENIVGEDLSHEKQFMLALPAEPFDTSEQNRVRVDRKSLITARQNRYSVPVALVGLMVSTRVGAERVRIYHCGKEVASHERLFGRFETRARLDHYLELLRQKPGALEGSLALSQERAAGDFPESLELLWQEITKRHGRSEAARQMVELLMLCRSHDPREVARAAATALTAGAIEGRAVEVMLRGRPPEKIPGKLAGLGPALTLHDRPPPDLSPYEKLMAVNP